MYDYLIVGAGLFGSIFAREATDAGYSCLIIEKRQHIGGNVYSEKIENIHVSKYGGHIFHTNDEKIWNYVNKYTEFDDYYHRLRVHYKEKLYSFPINLMTLYQIWGTMSPKEVEARLEQERVKIDNPENLEEWILSQIGPDLYEIFVKGYTQKQWNTDPKNLPSSIIKRIPIRTTYDDGYFSDRFQGWPAKGYTDLFVNLQEGIEVRLDTNFFNNRQYFENIASKIIYTGKIDEYYDYQFGELEYRSLRFDTKIVEGDFQGCATVNYTDAEVPYTRIIEHKHFQPRRKTNKEKSVITVEYPDDWNREKIPYYPVNDDNNAKVYLKYKKLAAQEENVIFGGRLAEYRYYDMHQVVGSALAKVKKELKNE